LNLNSSYLDRNYIKVSIILLKINGLLFENWTMKKDYKITREKFFDTDERKILMRVTEANSLLDRAKGRMTWQIRWMLIHIAMHSGLRVSEIADLRIGEIHLKNGSAYLYVRRGKRGKDRDVYIDAELAQHLKEFIKEKPILWDQPNKDEDYLFTGQGGGKMTTTALTISFTQAVKAAGLRKGLSIHSARHTYATIMYAKSDKNLKFVQKQLGHSSINMTALYADILPEENATIANKILE